jgi:hypothetical protein
MKMEAVYPYETSVNIYQTTRYHISESSTHHSHRCENLKRNGKDSYA